MAQELILSFVPDVEQRIWRILTRRKYQLTRDRGRLQNVSGWRTASLQAWMSGLGSSRKLLPVMRKQFLDSVNRVLRDK